MLKRFQDVLLTFTRSRNFDNLCLRLNGKTSGRPHLSSRVSVIKLAEVH